MKNIVIVYSKNGSNRYLAEKAAEALDTEVINIQPRFSSLFFIILAGLTGISMGNRSIKIDFSSYDSVLLCGPLYMGKPAAPLSDFIKKYSSDIRKISFITFCASTDSNKDDKFGYASVFKKIEVALSDKIGILEAFPSELILPAEMNDDEQAKMKIRLDDSNFKGPMKSRFDKFIDKIKMQ